LSLSKYSSSDLAIVSEFFHPSLVGPKKNKINKIRALHSQFVTTTSGTSTATKPLAQQYLKNNNRTITSYITPHRD
jgi:hypothetical protein